MKMIELPKEDHVTDSILVFKESERIAVVTIGSKNIHVHLVKGPTLSTLVL